MKPLDLVPFDYEGVFPPEHISTRRAELRSRFAELLEYEIGSL